MKANVAMRTVTGTGKLPRGTSLLAAVALVAAATILCEQARPYLSPVNMVMAYLLAVVFAAVFLGRTPAVVTAFLGVLAFDFFFVPPRFSFTIAEKEYLFTFLALFTVGLVISTLVAELRERLEELRVREVQTLALYHLSSSLAVAADRPAAAAAVVKNIEETLGARVAVFLPEPEGLQLAASSAGPHDHDRELEVARWCFQSGRMAGNGTDTYAGSELTFIPVKALTDPIGVLGITLDRPKDLHTPEMRRLLSAFATQTALALERVRLMHEAQQAQMLKARETLGRALLNSISHDLRTPLAAVMGAISTVLEERDKLSEEARVELLETAREEAGRLNLFVGNLLDMTRLEAGALRPRREPCDVQDLVGCALAAMAKRTDTSRFRVELDPELPLLAIDLPLMVQVMVNLLDNAMKYGPAEADIEIASHGEGDRVFIEVADSGPGIAEAELARIFDKFYRTPVPEAVGGTGLGLSICKGIVEAHGGTIRAENRGEGGLRIIIVLPAADLPDLELKHDDGQ